MKYEEANNEAEGGEGSSDGEENKDKFFCPKKHEMVCIKGGHHAKCAIKANQGCGRKCKNEIVFLCTECKYTDENIDRKILNRKVNIQN